MEQVLQCYGKGIAAGIVLIAVMVLLFAGIRDEQGNRGIINISKDMDTGGRDNHRKRCH